MSRQFIDMLETYWQAHGGGPPADVVEVLSKTTHETGWFSPTARLLNRHGQQILSALEAIYAAQGKPELEWLNIIRPRSEMDFSDTFALDVLMRQRGLDPSNFVRRRELLRGGGPPPFRYGLSNGRKLQRVLSPVNARHGAPDATPDALRESVTALEAAVSNRPSEWVYWCELSRVYSRLGELAKAVRAAEKCLKLQPANPVSGFALATCLRMVAGISAVSGLEEYNDLGAERCGRALQELGITWDQAAGRALGLYEQVLRTRVTDQEKHIVRECLAAIYAAAGSAEHPAEVEVLYRRFLSTLEILSVSTDSVAATASAATSAVMQASMSCPPHFSQHLDRLHGFSVCYPTGWRKDEDANKDKGVFWLFFGSPLPDAPKGFKRIAIAVGPSIEGPGLASSEEVLLGFVSRWLKAHKAQQVGGPRAIVLSGHRAVQVSYEHRESLLSRLPRLIAQSAFVWTPDRFFFIEVGGPADQPEDIEGLYREVIAHFVILPLE